MKRALYPGSFDPITNGHLDVICRAAELFEEIVVAVAVNDSKSPLFSAQERAELVYQSLHKGIPPVRVLILEGLLAEFAWKNQIQVVVRGLRAISDFESLRSKRVWISFVACWMAFETSCRSILLTTSNELSLAMARCSLSLA